MIEAIVGAGTVVVIAGLAAAYKLGIANGRKNGNGNGKIDLSQYATKEMCLLRHKSIDESLAEIKNHTANLPGVIAWIDLQKEKDE